MKINMELYLKVDFVGMGRVYIRPISGTGKRNTYGYSRILVVLLCGHSRDLLRISSLLYRV